MAMANDATATKVAPEVAVGEAVAITKERMLEIQEYLANRNRIDQTDSREAVRLLHPMACELMAALVGDNWAAASAVERAAVKKFQIEQRDWDRAHNFKLGEFEALPAETQAKFRDRPMAAPDHEPPTAADLEAKRAEWDRVHGLKPGEYDRMSPEDKARIDQMAV
jgi:hypothetical protein